MALLLPFKQIIQALVELNKCSPRDHPYGTTNAVYGTTNADAGEGIGLTGGVRNLTKRGYELADKAIN